MGPRTQTFGPDPRGSGVQHYMLLDASLEHCGHQYPAWPTLFIDCGIALPVVNAGQQGPEVAILQCSAPEIGR